MYAEGGRPFYDDDIQTIQDEAKASILAVLAGLGHDCIVQGCTVAATGATYTVAPGVVYMGGQLLRCLGASGVSLPAALVTGSISVLDERTYQTGDTKTCIQEQFAEVVANATVGLQLYPAGGFTMAHALRNQVNERWDAKWGRLSTANYDSSGLGLPGTPAWGWALCNGQNGTDDLRKRFVVNYDPDETDYAAVGSTGGAAAVTLDLTQLPAHNHPSDFRITDSRSGDTSPFTAGWTSTPNANGKNITTKSVGGGQPFDNRPPFYVLAARQWVGF